MYYWAFLSAAYLDLHFHLRRAAKLYSASTLCLGLATDTNISVCECGVAMHLRPWGVWCPTGHAYDDYFAISYRLLFYKRSFCVLLKQWVGDVVQIQIVIHCYWNWLLSITTILIGKEPIASR